MSKRAGRIIEMQEVIDEVGVDAARFFFVNRKCSSHLDFDIDLAKNRPMKILFTMFSMLMPEFLILSNLQRNRAGIG